MPQRSERSTPSDDVVDLRAYVDVLRHRWRLIVASALAFLVLANLYSFTRTATYTSLAEVLVEPPGTSQTFRPDQLVSVDTEARLVASASIAAIARKELDTQLTIPELLEHVSVETTPDSLVLDISFHDGDPSMAADGANAFAVAYLDYKRERAQEALQEERGTLQGMMDELTRERDRQNLILETEPSGSLEYRNAQSQRDILNGQIAILAAQLTQIPVTVDPGEIILPATVPTEPSSPKHAVNLALGLFLGLFFGVIAAFVWDRMDDRVRSRDDLEDALRAPMIAGIPAVLGWDRRGPAVLVTEQQPKSPAAEAYRTLRTSVMAMGNRRDMRILGIGGAAMGEGKTTTVANLAASLAHADKSVLAISADLRRPRLHEFFDLPNDRGLSEVLSGEASLQDVVRRVGANLHVITSGAVPTRPAELLQSPKMGEILDAARARFEFVLIDLPPVLGLADTLSVAPLVDGLLLVAQEGRTRQIAIRHAVQQLERVGAAVHGGVLNGIVRTRQNEYRYGYDYADKPAERERTDLGAALRGGLGASDDDREAEDAGTSLPSPNGPVGDAPTSNEPTSRPRDRRPRRASSEASAAIVDRAEREGIDDAASDEAPDEDSRQSTRGQRAHRAGSRSRSRKW